MTNKDKPQKPYVFIHNGHDYSYDPATQQLSRVKGDVLIPVTKDHPSVFAAYRHAVSATSTDQ